MTARLRWGYTLADLNRLARIAAYAARARWVDLSDRYDTSWSAIAEHLYATDTAPSERDLVDVALTACARTAEDELHTYGFTKGDVHAGVGSMARWVTYWSWVARTPTPEDLVVDRMAVRQILPTLTHSQRQAVGALAALEDHAAAARALGLTDGAYLRRLSTARARVRALWVEGETPRGAYRQDKRVRARGEVPATHCAQGHEWTEANTRIRRSGFRQCKACSDAAARRWWARKREAARAAA